MIKYLISILFLISIINCANNLVPEQETAINELNIQLEQNLDLLFICENNIARIRCNTEGTVVILFKPYSPSSTKILSDSILALVNLTELAIPLNIQVQATFWTNISQLTSLNKLTLGLGDSFPNDFGTFFPSSLEIIIIPAISDLLPDSFFTKTNLKEIYIGYNNVVDYMIFPSTISSPSKITTLHTRSGGLFNMDGSNFLNVISLEISYFNGNPNYDKYDTFPNLQSLSIQINSLASTAPFPTSIFNITTLISIDLSASNKLSAPESNMLDFSKSPSLSTVAFYEMDFLVSLTFPGFIQAKEDGELSQLTILLHDSNINFANFDLFNYQSVTLKDMVFSSLPQGDYSTIADFTISGLYSGVIIDSVCEVRHTFSLLHSGVSSLPSCFQCNWNNPLFIFDNNTALPSYSPTTCASLQITNTTPKIPTKGGFLIIEGLDLGWNVFSLSNDVFIGSKVLIGNKKLQIPISRGSGLDISFYVKFHADVNPDSSSHKITYRYMPPILTNVMVGNVYIHFEGSNFGLNPIETTLIVAGKQLNIISVLDSDISTKVSELPYTDNLVMSVEIIINGQSSYQIYRSKVNSSTILYQPIPILYTNGGIVEFFGEWLSFDTTIMNMTIDGKILFTNYLQNSSSTKLTFSYPSNLLQAGTYSLEFNLDVYQLITTIIVKNPPLQQDCKGTPICNGNGQCSNGQCICNDGWTGEICDSKNTPLPPFDNPDTNNPNINTTIDGGLGLHISIISIKELNYKGEEQREEFLSDWEFTQEITDEKQTLFYTTQPFSDKNTTVNVTINYFFKDVIVEFAGQSSKKIAGSIKYSANITSWPFLQSLNQLEIIFQSSLKDNLESQDSCSYKNIEYSQIDEEDVKSVNIQINKNTFTTTFSNYAVVDNVNRIVKNIFIPNDDDDQDSNTESNAMIGIITPYHHDFILIDPDLNLLVTYVDPSKKSGSICSDSQNSKLTKAQLAGIIIGSVVVGLTLILILVFLMKRSIRVKLAFLKMKSKMDKL